ncbi:MAG: aldose 1-epimerase [Ilumatobacteraceae bacterium]
MTLDLVELSAGSVRLVVDPGRGARLSSLSIDGDEMLVGPLDESGRQRPSFEWGSYPMAPFAGRIRHGRFEFGGGRFEIERRMEPHAIHGMVDDVEWSVVTRTSNELLVSVETDRRWPFGCRVEQHLTLRADRLRLRGTVIARDTMPAQIGWHPWFRRPTIIDHAFHEWLPRDTEGLPLNHPVGSPPALDSTVDDCFVATGGPIALRVGSTRLALSSDSSHWVVYNGAAHGVCVEPQSGPPNAVESGPHVLGPGQSLERWFEIDWSAT